MFVDPSPGLGGVTNRLVTKGLRIKYIYLEFSKVNRPYFLLTVP
jgi:hypothetical protein